MPIINKRRLVVDQYGEIDTCAHNDESSFVDQKRVLDMIKRTVKGVIINNSVANDTGMPSRSLTTRVSNLITQTVKTMDESVMFSHGLDYKPDTVLQKNCTSISTVAAHMRLPLLSNRIVFVEDFIDIIKYYVNGGGCADNAVNLTNSFYSVLVINEQKYSKKVLPAMTTFSIQLRQYIITINNQGFRDSLDILESDTNLFLMRYIPLMIKGLMLIHKLKSVF